MVAGADIGSATPTALSRTRFLILPGPVSRFNIAVGIHVHNDGGLAVKPIMAVEAGAVHVQVHTGSANAIGNANLSTIIPNLQLKEGYRCIRRRTCNC